jgi:hypothetical protein
MERTYCEREQTSGERVLLSKAWPRRSTPVFDCLGSIVSHKSAIALVLPFLLACEAPDNSAVRSFHAGVQPGTSLLQVVQEGERAQKEDVHFSVTARDCPGPYVELGRDYEILHIRITQPPAASNPSSASGYVENGYASRDEFARAVADQLPEYYTCKSFRFEFGRDQVWPTMDCFTVQVDADGTVVSVSDLKEE